MIVYGSSLSPFVRKVLAVAEEKGLAVKLTGVNLRAPDADFLEASPFRKVPAFRDGDFTLSDSSAIATYLDAIGSGPALIPEAPKARGRTIWFDEFADTILTAAGTRIFFNRVVGPRFMGVPGDLAVAEKAEREELPPICDYLERVLPASGFLVEDRLTLADIAVACPFATLSTCSVRVDEGRHPKLARFVAAMTARPSFAKWLARDLAMLAG